MRNRADQPNPLPPLETKKIEHPKRVTLVVSGLGSKRPRPLASADLIADARQQARVEESGLAEPGPNCRNMRLSNLNGVWEGLHPRCPRPRPLACAECGMIRMLVSESGVLRGHSAGSASQRWTHGRGLSRDAPNKPLPASRSRSRK